MSTMRKERSLRSGLRSGASKGGLHAQYYRANGLAVAPADGRRPAGGVPIRWSWVGGDAEALPRLSCGERGQLGSWSDDGGGEWDLLNLSVF